jgi:branched-chain amino acid transport system substrate-binding protein
MGGTKMENKSKLSRRDLLLASAAGALSMPILGSLSPAFAADKITIGFISPITGPLGGFGETDGHVLSLARKALEKGLMIGGKSYAVEIFDRDTQSDPSRAGQLAKELIGAGVDLMLAVSTPETINPVADACEAAGVPCLSTVMPWESWYFGRGAKPGQPSPFKWTYHFGFGVDEFLKAYIKQWSLIETNKKVGVMYPNDADGNAIRAVLAPQLSKAGFTIIDPGAYETGTTDYSSQIALFKKEGVEIFNTFPIPPDFAAFWRQAAQQGLNKQIKIVQVAKTGLFPSGVEALGTLGVNLSTACYWHKTFPYKSSLTGISSAELADSYEAASGKQWTQQLGASLSLIDVGTEALKASANPKDKVAVVGAIAKLNVSTIGGKVDFTSGPVPNVALGPIIGSQWVKSADGKHPLDLVVTENTTDPNVPVAAKLIAYNK